MHDLRDELRDAGVPEPNRADRRKAEALERLGPKKAKDREEPGYPAAEDVEAANKLQCPDEARKPAVRRLPGGVRHVRCGPPRKS